MTALTINPSTLENSPASKSNNPPEIEKKFKMIAEDVTISYGDFAAVKNITMK